MGLCKINNVHTLQAVQKERLNVAVKTFLYFKCRSLEKLKLHNLYVASLVFKLNVGLRSAHVFMQDYVIWEHKCERTKDEFYSLGRTLGPDKDHLYLNKNVNKQMLNFEHLSIHMGKIIVLL
jgi:hypothetical protein